MLVGCRYAGLDAHLVLRNRASEVDADPGLVGNLLVERLVGAHIYQVCPLQIGAGPQLPCQVMSTSLLSA